MIKFRKISINDKEWIDKCLSEGDTDGSSYSFGSLYGWGESYSLEIAEYESMLLIRGKDSFGRYYAYPSGKGDIKAAVCAMMELSVEEGEIFRLVQLLESNKTALQTMFPDMFDYSYNRDASEYVYSVENMANLAGKKFHGKKGHVNAFFKKHEDITCDPITDDNIHYCLDIARAWMSERDENEELDAELCAIKKAVDNYAKLGYEGAILFADGKAVAFTMGEPLKNNTFCTHFEKTLPDYRDAYPVINNGFTKLMLMTYEFVNREEDLGQEGLRKAKLSYQPAFLLDKYSAVLKNDPARKFRAEENDIPDLKNLWQTVFGDDEKTVDFFLENTAKLSDVYAYKKDGRVVSAFYLIDAPVKSGKNTLNCKYLYAAATLDEYRKQGIMGEMIEYAVNILKMSGCDGIFLYPADEKLYNYYEKFGFSAKFYSRSYVLENEQIEKYKNQRYFNTVLSYYDMRQNVAAENYADFGVGYLDFVRYCTRLGGIEISVVFDDEDKVFIIGHSENDTLYVDEAFSSEGQTEHILGVIADMNYKKTVLNTPADLMLGGFGSLVQKSGMMNLFADDDKIYYLGQPCM